MPKEMEVECPECKTKTKIYSQSNPDGTCANSECGLNVQAVYEKLRHERALETARQQTAPKKKSPFSFD